MRLAEYSCLLRSQGYASLQELTQISIEDLEDVGIFKLGHQKRFLLGIKRLKELRSRSSSSPGSPFKNGFRYRIPSLPSPSAAVPAASPSPPPPPSPAPPCPQQQQQIYASSTFRPASAAGDQKPVYQPDVISIARPTTQQQLFHQQQQLLQQQLHHQQQQQQVLLHQHQQSPLQRQQPSHATSESELQLQGM